MFYHFRDALHHELKEHIVIANKIDVSIAILYGIMSDDSALSQPRNLSSTKLFWTIWMLEV